MTSGLVALVVVLATSPAVTLQRAPEPGTEVVIGVYEGRTPCGPLANEFTRFPSAGCEKIKWRLTLRHDSAGNPATYTYRGTRTAHHGGWRRERAAGPDGKWDVYHLAYGQGKTLSLLSVQGHVLLLLDGKLNVMVGDASWSYVFNKVS